MIMASVNQFTETDFHLIMKKVISNNAEAEMMNLPDARFISAFPGTPRPANILNPGAMSAAIGPNNAAADARAKESAIKIWQLLEEIWKSTKAENKVEKTQL